MSFLYSHPICIRGFCILRFNNLWFKNIQEEKYSGGKYLESSKKQNLNLPHAKKFIESMQMKWYVLISVMQDKFFRYYMQQGDYIVNNIVCLKFAERVDLKCPHHKKKINVN